MSRASGPAVVVLRLQRGDVTILKASERSLANERRPATVD
jgi:hypothetical protein